MSDSQLKKTYLNNLLQSIPVVQGMEVSIDAITDRSVTLKAPLNTHINYEGTAFGGSLNTMCVLSCYLMVHHLMKISEVSFQSLVIQNSSIEYLRPVQSDFYAQASLNDEAQAQTFLSMLDKKGKGRIEVEAIIFCRDDISKPLVRFTGRFVAKA